MTKSLKRDNPPDFENKTLICYGCQVALEPRQTEFEYLGHAFHTDVLRCPKCGEVYIPESLVKKRMAEVEMLLEDK